MSKKRKILVLIGLTLLLALGTVVTVVFYSLGSPGKVKALIEQSISRATGTECSIRELSYSLNPLFLRAREIQLIDHVRKFHLDIPALVTELSLQGSFTRRTLVVNHLTLQGFSLNTDYSSGFGEPGEKPQAPGFFSRLARRVVALLLFRDIRIDSAELSGGQVNCDMGEQLLTMREIQLRLKNAEPLQISCHARLRWPSADMEVTLPHLLLTADQAISIVDPEIRASLKSEGMTLTMSRGKAESFSGEAQIVYDRDRKLLIFNSASLSSETLLMRQGSGSASPPVAMAFNADGFVDLSTGRADAQRFHLMVRQIMEATGAFHAETGAHPQVTLSNLVLQLTLRNTWPLLAETLGIAPSSFAFEGEAWLTGDLNGLFEGNAWQWRGDLQTRLKDGEVSFTTRDTRGRGQVTADIQLKGLYPNVESTLALAVEKAELSSKGIGVKAASAAFTASGKGLDFDVQNLDFRVPLAEVMIRGQRIRVQDIHAVVPSGTLSSSRAQLSFPRIDLHSSLVKNLHLSLDAHEGQVTLGLEGKEVGIFSLTRALSLVPPDWQLGGLDSVSMKGSRKEDGHWLLESRWNLDQVAFQSPDLRYAGEKISFALNIRGSGSVKESVSEASVEGSMVNGGLLYDRIYLDLGKNSLHFQFQGDYDISVPSAGISGFQIVLKDLLTLEGDGQVTDLMLRHPCHLRVRLPRLPLKAAFQWLVKEPLEREMPFLAGLDMGGTLSAEMDFRRGIESWRLLGRCSWRGGEVVGKGFTLEGIELDLPFWGEKPGTSAGSSFDARFALPKNFPREGSLFIQSVALPYLTEQSLSVRAHVAPNTLSFILQDSVKVGGGEIELDPLSLKGLFNLSPSLTTGVTLKGIDLDPLLLGLWPRPVPGTVQGRLDVVNFSGDRMQTRGKVNVQAFGGEILVSNLGASGVFGSTPSFLLDATWRDINLAELTEGTPFEKVEGILKGEIRHLEVVGGEPQQFDLFMETTKTRDIPQKISVRALENIARIGGGASPFIGLAGAFTSLFKEFPYDKIAVQASLENDVFRIGGPLREGDKVYLVKRSGLSGVNVVNQDPNGRISFKDMMKRIKRVTAAQEGPPGEEEPPKSEILELRN
jgi:hypothetical protein